MEQGEHSRTADGSANLRSHYGSQYGNPKVYYRTHIYWTLSIYAVLWANQGSENLVCSTSGFSQGLPEKQQVELPEMSGQKTHWSPLSAQQMSYLPVKIKKQRATREERDH